MRSLAWPGVKFGETNTAVKMTSKDGPCMTYIQTRASSVHKNEEPTPKADDNSTVTRRHFVQGVVATGLAALIEGQFNQVGAETIARPPSVLTGNHFDLAIEAHHVGFTGRRVKAMTVNGSSP